MAGPGTPPSSLSFTLAGSTGGRQGKRKNTPLLRMNHTLPGPGSQALSMCVTSIIHQATADLREQTQHLGLDVAQNRQQGIV